MIGFRHRLSTQDAMLQLKQEIIDNKTQDTKVILGLDLQSAFDKIKHSAILAEVSRLNMGVTSYNYIEDFLTNRTVELHAGDLKLPERKLGSMGTPQGSVISPLLFNLVMIGVARAVAATGVRHTIYADDITLWVAGGTDASIEQQLQAAVTTIEQHLEGTGLVCSPAKSELFVFTPLRAGRKRAPPRECDHIKIVTASGQRIPEVSKIRVLGLLLNKSGRNDETINKLTTKAMEAIRLIHRVSTRRAGMREDSLVRLVQSFVISHIAYVAAYLNWHVTDRTKINTLIRRAYKTALGLTETTSTARLLQLGVHNTLEEIAEAQLTAQMERLSATKTGRSILASLGYNPRAPSRQPCEISEEARAHIHVDPIPKNVHPEYNQERRQARAKALTKQHAQDPHARYVDASEYEREGFAAVVVAAATGTKTTAASVRCTDATDAEEVAIALAISEAECRTVLSDSRNAVRNFAKGRVCAPAAAIIGKLKLQDRGSTIRIKWFPAHAGECTSSPNHNETAHSAARALTLRSPESDRSVWWFETKDRMTSYSEVTKCYRLARRTMPPPHPALSREEAVILRQIQTGSLPAPAVLHVLHPELYPSGMCSVCAVGLADQWHIMWDCARFPTEATSRTYPPELQSAVQSTDKDTQLWAVQQARGALEKHKPHDPPQTGRTGVLQSRA
ncbi:uncharacterized protein LOC144173402 [Haemaphysalis longicornis]